jgi:hypothetical protein
MILKLNHLPGKAAPTAAQEVSATLYSLLEEGRIDQAAFSHLQVELDWIQYKQNFRDVATAICGSPGLGQPSRLMEVRVDTRQVTPGTLRDDMLKALARANPDASPQEQDILPLEDFQSLRTSIVWDFNRLYWTRLNDWEEATGKGYEQALPGGVSDGHRPDAIADSASDFWTLLHDLEARKQLPAEIFMLELGVGTGVRFGLWLDKFKEIDDRHQTGFYPKLRVLLGDYSLATIEKSRPAVEKHADLCSFLVLDAVNPLKTLSFLRHKIMQVHSTNVFDNLPDEEIARRDGKMYFVQVRAYIPATEAQRLATVYDRPLEKIRSTVARLLEGGFEQLGDKPRGVQFWQDVWRAVRLEERLVPFEELPDYVFPGGLDVAKLQDILTPACPGDMRIHLSSGALNSFVNTLPLLHPRGHLQVNDIFVTDFEQYRMGYYGPGKLDGSLLNWVNGALLREVAQRAGYDVHFAPFHYRKESKNSILYTTRRD